MTNREKRAGNALPAAAETPEPQMPAPPAEVYVTTAKLRLKVSVDGRSYTLRPLTYGEQGEVAAAMGASPSPTFAVINHYLREACAGDEKAIADIDAFELANDKVQAHKDAEPLIQEEPARAAEWRDEAKRLALEAAPLARRWEVLRFLHADAVFGLDLRRLQARRRNTVNTLRRMIVAWSGDELPEFRPSEDGVLPFDVVNGLPGPDIDVLEQYADKLGRPGRVEVGN